MPNTLQLIIYLTITLALFSSDAPAQNIFNSTMQEPNQKTEEISTEQLQKILKDKSAVLFDARPYNEYAVSHIPGAQNVSAKPDVPISVYVSDTKEIERLVRGDKAASIVLYCNGPFCGKSKRLASELLQAGYTNVRRYQLGIPVWRALGGVTQIEESGMKYVFENDRTAVFIDTRDSADFKKGTITRAKNIPYNVIKNDPDKKMLQAAKDDGRLPMEDHNTRIIVFGNSPEEVKTVAEAIAKEAFHNVSFFSGNFQQFINTGN